MSRIEELINRLCPDGVEFKKLGEVAEVGTGSSNRQDAENDGIYPFFVRSKEILKSSNFEFDEEAIIIPGEGGIGEIFHYVNGKYSLHQRVYRIHFFNENINAKFVFFFMYANFKKFILKKAVTATVSSIRKPMITEFKIPIPPLEIQQEIVRILDNFTELTNELTNELTARKKQYEYYRDKLLSFDKDDDKVKWMKLGEVAEINTGKKPKIIFENNGEYEYINAGTTNSGFTDCFNCFGDVVTTPSRGQGGIGFVGYQKNKFWLGPLCYKIFSKTDSISNKYIYYILSLNNNKILKLKREAGVPAINMSDLISIRIPIPPIETQRRIVSILDRFDQLCNDLTAGLPAEIEARRKQYEYYRDKLLTFKEKKA